MKKRKKLSEYLVLRKRAIELHKDNKKQTEIASALGTSQSTISEWIREYKKRGAASFDYSKVGGSKRRLAEIDQLKLVDLLNQGAAANGYDGDLWTRRRVQHLIKEQFKISYGLTAVGDLLRDLGFTVQKPDKRSYKQDPEKVRYWKEEHLPKLKKKP